MRYVAVYFSTYAGAGKKYCYDKDIFFPIGVEYPKTYRNIPHIPQSQLLRMVRLQWVNFDIPQTYRKTYRKPKPFAVSIFVQILRQRPRIVTID